MGSIYQQDLAYIQAVAFGSLARGVAPYIVQRLKSASVHVRHVVDVGCGAGVLTAALIAAGFQVTAIDASAELLSLARKSAPTAEFIHASAYDSAVPPCDAIIALGEVLAYQLNGEETDARVNAFIRHCAEVLPRGGMLIFDVIELGEPSLAGRSWTSGADWAILVDTAENQRQRTLVRTIETFRLVNDLYRRGNEVHTVRLFDTDALCHQLASCGFMTEITDSYGPHPLAPRRRAFFATRA